MMDWDECLRRNFVKKNSFDVELVKSLKKGSSKKTISNKKLVLDEDTAETKIGIVYDSLREILEALSIKKGFKIYNHECYVGFIDGILKMKENSIEFDKFRKIRNGINYYGKVLSIDNAKVVIENILILRDKFLRILDE